VIPQRARIRAADYQDWDEDSAVQHDRSGAGIRIALDEPHLLVPANPPLRDPYVLLPHGSTIQVHDTAEHLAGLAPLVGPMGEQWAYATCAASSNNSPARPAPSSRSGSTVIGSAGSPRS
jgi:hypothetical protein